VPIENPTRTARAPVLVQSEMTMTLILTMGVALVAASIALLVWAFPKV
jgi:hypothetical protein